MFTDLWDQADVDADDMMFTDLWDQADVDVDGVH